MGKSKMTPVQRAAHNLLQCDFRYICTILSAEKILPPNYSVAMIPYLGLITDGAENWVSAMNRSHPRSVDMPNFTSQEKAFYQTARESIKRGKNPTPKFIASCKIFIVIYMWKLAVSSLTRQPDSTPKENELQIIKSLLIEHKIFLDEQSTE